MVLQNNAPLMELMLQLSKNLQELESRVSAGDARLRDQISRQTLSDAKWAEEKLMLIRKINDVLEPPKEVCTVLLTLGLLSSRSLPSFSNRGGYLFLHVACFFWSCYIVLYDAFHSCTPAILFRI